MQKIRILLTLLFIVLCVSSVKFAAARAENNQLFLPIVEEPAIVNPNDVIDVMINDDNYDEFLRALQAADMVDELRNGDPFTVFAPTDEAFTHLPPGAWDQLLLNPSGQLTDILRFHVVADELAYADLYVGQQITTLHGADARINEFDGRLQINGADISEPDLLADNGVVHGIDAIILPPIE